MKYILCTIIILFSSISFAESFKVPDGWRIPTSTDVHHRDNDRNQDKYQYLRVIADFNGDKIIDEAYLLINDSYNKMGLFVYLSKGTDHTVMKLDEGEKYIIKNMGISLAKPGMHKTACGKGYWKCDKDEPAILYLKLPAINFFTFESANSYWYWNKKLKLFKQIWISD